MATEHHKTWMLLLLGYLVNSPIPQSTRFKCDSIHAKERQSPPVITRPLMSPTMPSRATPTLANAVAATAANGTLSPRQRHDRMSAIRTVARVIGRDPTDIPAEPRLLARRLAEIGPAAHGLSPARWANIRSLVRAVVAEITTISPGRHQNALTPSAVRAPPPCRIIAPYALLCRPSDRPRGCRPARVR